MSNSVWGRLRRLLRGNRTDADDWYRVSFSQEGEDLLLLSLFGDRESGFYVDVGAHHPRKYSNTFAFYSRGWAGMNIDAMPGSMRAFAAARPRDINLELAIADTRQVLTFYEFTESALNGFDPDGPGRRAAALRGGSGAGDAARVVSQREISTVPLSEVLDKHLPAGQAIDFLNVDVEGLDYAVLASNNWDKYRPSVVLAEDADAPTLDALGASRIARFLHDRGYQPVCRTRLTTIFVRRDQLGRDPFGAARIVSGHPAGDTDPAAAAVDASSVPPVS